MNELNFLISNIQKKLDKKYKEILSEYDFNYNDILVLNALIEYKELIAREISDITNIEKGTLNPIINKLENEGYIQRIRPVNDERTFKITLTKKGSSIKKKILNISSELDSQILLNQKEKITFKNLLEKLNNKI